MASEKFHKDVREAFKAGYALALEALRTESSHSLGSRADRAIEKEFRRCLGPGWHSAVRGYKEGRYHHLLMRMDRESMMMNGHHAEMYIFDEYSTTDKEKWNGISELVGEEKKVTQKSGPYYYWPRSTGKTNFYESFYADFARSQQEKQMQNYVGIGSAVS